jgi:hypothetical protein
LDGALAIGRRVHPKPGPRCALLAQFLVAIFVSQIEPGVTLFLTMFYKYPMLHCNNCATHPLRVAAAGEGTPITTENEHLWLS